MVLLIYGFSTDLCDQFSEIERSVMCSRERKDGFLKMRKQKD